MAKAKVGKATAPKEDNVADGNEATPKEDKAILWKYATVISLISAIAATLALILNTTNAVVQYANTITIEGKPLSLKTKATELFIPTDIDVALYANTELDRPMADRKYVDGHYGAQAQIDIEQTGESNVSLVSLTVPHDVGTVSAFIRGNGVPVARHISDENGKMLLPYPISKPGKLTIYLWTNKPITQELSLEYQLKDKPASDFMPFKLN